MKKILLALVMLSCLTACGAGGKTSGGLFSSHLIDLCSAQLNT